MENIWNIFLYIVVSLFLLVGSYYCFRYYYLKHKLCSSAKRIVDRLYAGHKKIKQDLAQKEADFHYKEKASDIAYNKLKQSLQETYDAKIKDIQAEYAAKYEQDNKELNEAIDNEVQELTDTINKVDAMLEAKVREMTLDNTLLFDCACGEQDIPCFISLNKESTFRCKKCNHVYSVQSKFSPVLIGTASSDEEFQKIIESRLRVAEAGEEEEDVF